MYRLILLALIAVTFNATQTLANPAGSAPATYLLEVSSNLNCEELHVELIPQQGDKNQYLKFTTSAFAAVDLPAGAYAFGNVTCKSGNDSESFEMLKDKFELLYLSAGRAYYGGRMIFKQTEEVDPNEAPKVLKNCTRNISRARGEVDNQCRDGVGVDTSAAASRQISAYVPEVTDDHISVVRNALKVNEDQLLYLPLKSKG